MATTVDSKEIDYFNKMALVSNDIEWWKDFAHLYKMNQTRVPFFVNGIKQSGICTEFASLTKPLKGLRILDVGSGAGYLSEPLAKLGATVIGLDAAQEIINLATAHLNEDQEIKSSVSYVNGTIEDFCQYNKNYFDVVVASEIIEHVNNPELFLKSCVETLKPGGSIFITTINKTWSSWITAIILYEYVFRLIPKGTHEWIKFISPEDVSKLLKTNNCDTNLVTGISYNILSGNFSFISNTSVFYQLHAIKKKY